MKPWSKRPLEEANLLNPAFCCLTISTYISSYTDFNNEGMPYPLIFMGLPIILHKSTRDSFPYSIRTSLPFWIQENVDRRILFFERTVSLKPYTQEALLFGLLHNWLVLKNGKFQATINSTDIKRFLRQLEGESMACIKQANFLGKWFASAGSAETVMSLWGIRP